MYSLFKNVVSSRHRAIYGGACVAGIVVCGALYKRLKFTAISEENSPEQEETEKQQLFQDFKNALHVYSREIRDFVESCGVNDINITHRLDRVIDYNCRGGKMTRGFTVVITTRDLCHKKGISFEKYRQEAFVIGWAIEFLQAAFLVADDVMDKSITRRHKPCWYNCVGLMAINDAFLLEGCVHYLISTHIHNIQTRSKIQNLFLDVILRTEIGQMIDTMSEKSANKESSSLNQFTSERYLLIVKHKTSYYTFYLPLAAAIILTHNDSREILDKINDVSILLGEKFQIQDDYLDCFGDSNTTGKVGTDISDNKCTWLIVQALQLCNNKQHEQLIENYGKKSNTFSNANTGEHVVKEIYKALDLPKLFQEKEQISYDQCIDSINILSKSLPHIKQSCITLLDMIHCRKR